MYRLASSLALLFFISTGVLSGRQAEDWKSVVDPAAKKIDWPTDYKLDVVTPKSFFDPSLTFADQGPYAICGLNGKNDEHRAVIDLRTGKETGRLSGQFPISTPEALSPEGTLFATCAKVNNKDLVAVLDLKAKGKIIAQIPFPGPQGPFPTKPDSIRFIGNERLLLSFGKTSVQVYDIKTVKMVSEVKTENSPWRHATPIPTPGGKFIAVPDNKTLHFHETDTGKEVASIPAINGNFDAISISPDGTRLAAVMESFGKRKLMVVDLANGNTITDVAMEGNGHAFYAGPKVAWAADNSGILYWGMTMLDPATGKAVFPLPGGGTSPAPVFPVSLGAVVKLNSVSGERKLQALTLAPDKLAATKAAIQSGGSAIDALLPPVLASVTAGAKDITVPIGRQNWSVGIDQAPAGFAYERPIIVDFPLNGLQSIRVCGGQSPVAVYDFASVNVFQQPDHTVPRTLKKVDLRTGRSTSQEMPPGCAIADLSLDGSAVVTIDATTSIRADIHSLKGAKPIGFKPYEKENGDAKKVAFAYLITPTRLLTVSATGTVAAWDMTSGKAIYIAQVPGFIPVSLSSGRKYICGTQNGMIRFFDTTTGEPAGDLAPSFIAQTGHAVQWGVAINQDGTKATGVFTKPGVGLFITRFDMKTGKTLDETLLRTAYPEWPKPAYIGDRLLFNGRDLYDPVRKAVVWHYASLGTTIAVQRPDGQLWYGIGGPNNSSLVAAKLPSKDVSSTVEAVADGPGSILKPGAKIAVALEFSGTHGGETRDKTSDIISKLWASRGIEVTDKAPVTLRVRASERDTGKKMEFTTVFRPAFARPGSKAVDSARLMEVTIETSILLDGRAVWSAPVVTHQNRPPHGIFTVPKEESSVESFLLRRMWDGVPPVATNNLPEFLTNTPQGIKSLPGNSQLTASGIVDQR